VRYRSAWSVAALLGALSLLALTAVPALAAKVLPRTYQVQSVDTPTPATNANFGLAFVNAGDLNGDGKPELLVGTDEHGGSLSPVHILDTATGSVIRSITAPDGGGSGNPAGFGSYVGSLPDIASCPGGTSGVTCPNNPSGGPDGVPELLVTALGVDVGGLVDAGRAYVLDGATGAVLKRLDMPAADITDQLGKAGPPKPAFGRTILNPSSQFGPTANDLSGPTTPPLAVRIGDMNGGGKPDIIVSASDYYETGATANPDSACAAAGPTAQCLQSGRSYVYYGESVAPTSGGTDPTTIDNTPDVTIKNPAAQPDDPTNPVNVNRENMGYSIEPVGDLGKCNTTPGAGRACTNANSTGTPDGLPDVVISSHRTDDFGMFDVGVALLIDGATDSLLYTYHHPEPQPASLFGFSNYNQPAPGDLGSSNTPDSYQAAMRQNNPFTGGGRGYGMNGAFKQGGSPNSISFSTFNDPTPQPSEDFGTSSAGIGDVFGDGRTEMMIGDYGPHNPGTNPNPINDVFIMSGISEQVLQTFNAPDQQPGGGFGTALAPLGDINGDGFQDYAIGAGLLQVGANPAQGRIYIFRSDNSPAPQTPPTSGPPAGPQGAQGPQGPSGAVAVVQSGRAIELVATSGRVRRGRSTTLRGALDAFANAASCERSQRVDLQRRSGSNPRYSTFARVRTDRRGNFSLKIKPTKSYTYRARIGESNQCTGTVSNRVSISVTRR
jgi:hypothetical protein